MTNPFREERGFRFIEYGERSSEVPAVCLHGLMGTADEWRTTVKFLANHGYWAIVPAIPFGDLSIRESTVDGVTKFVRNFTETLGLERVVLIGNSLGGQVAVRYELSYPESVAGLVLSGSAGVYEVATSQGLLRRQDRDYIRESAARAFFDKNLADDALVKRLYGQINDLGWALRLIRIGRNSLQNPLTARLSEVASPTAVIWGRDDEVTPAEVAVQFANTIPNADLTLLNECGHAPMIEVPDVYGSHIVEFLRRIIGDGVELPEVHSTCCGYA